MNSQPLSRLYDQLTPRERVPLIMAAYVRGDPAEQKWLSASATSVAGDITGHGTAFNRRRTVSYVGYAAAIVDGGVAGQGAAADRQRTVVQDGAARIVGDIAR